MLTISHVWDLPFGTGTQHMNHGIAGQIFGNWAINGVFTWASGTPFSVFADPLFNGGPNGTVLANVNGPVQITNQMGLNQAFFNTSAFSAPSAGSFGNTSRNFLRGPGFRNYNFSLFKTFAFMEHYKFEIRGEAFNLTNSPHFANPQANLNSGNFGTITSVGNGVDSLGRQVDFALRLIFLNGPARLRRGLLRISLTSHGLVFSENFRSSEPLPSIRWALHRRHNHVESGFTCRFRANAALRRAADALAPHVERLNRDFRRHLRPYDARERKALTEITPGAAARLLAAGKSVAHFLEQVDYNGRRLAKLNVAPGEVLKALAAYDRLLPDHGLRPLHSAIVLALNNAYYRVREAEAQAFFDLFRAELESANLDDLWQDSRPS